MSQISTNFHIAEFCCHDRAGTPVPPALLPNLTELVLAVLQPLRDTWGSPLIVVSGYRTLAWNMRVGGASGSTHPQAKGADIRPIHLRDVAQLHALVKGMRGNGRLPKLGGLGIYPGWIHVDTLMAADGRLRQWSGSGMGSEPG